MSDTVTYPNGLNSPIPPFWGFSAFTPTIPKLYWDVKSQEQRILNLFDLLDKIIAYADSIGETIDTSAEDIEALKKELQNLEDGGLVDYYEKQIYQWIQNNMESLVAAHMKQVYFGLTDDSATGGAGYFVAYIPDSWDEIVFDTGAVYGLDTYGRLILRWDADSPYTVEQTPEHTGLDLTDILAEIRTTANNALSLAQTNETDISANDGEIAQLDTRVTALENKTTTS